MKKRSTGKKLLGMALTFMTVFSLSLMDVSAAVGDLSNVSTGLTGNIDTSDTISLPIRILDYEADGMLFEYAEANGVKSAADFGATWYEDYTARTAVGGTINTGNYWSDVTLALKTGTYANYTRATWAGNTTANWTGNRAGVVLADFSTSSTYTTDQVRYMVIVFRSNVRSGNFTVGLNRANLNGAGTSGNYTGNIAVTTENNTNWTYAVLDLKTGTLGSNWSKGAVQGVYVGLPIDGSGEWMDIAHVAFFSNKDMATKFGEYALTDGSDRGDNRAFGLLRHSRTQSGGTGYTGIIDETTTVEQLNTYGDTTSVDFSTLTTLGYKLLGTFKQSGIANVGLLESSLSSEGYPVYKKEVVTYVANLLKNSLSITERTSDGWKNYRYVKGTASSIYGGTDLATALRNKINGTMGTYAAATEKDLVGTWEECGGNIASYYDAAYFLLNSIFVSGSYNELQDDYDYLVLSAGTDSTTGDKVYIFDGGFTTSATPASARIAINYDSTKRIIQNSTAAGKTHFVYEGNSTTTLNPFLPVTEDNNATGQTKSVYYQDPGVLSTVATKDTYVERDFNFAMVSEGEFVYHEDENLFFEFEGDDDVYLFIDGELVMDIGSAHSIDGVRFELNDYVEAAKAGTLGSAERNKKLTLEEGDTYSFKFYYMERHGYGSNIRINTNIKVTDPSMVTEKTAYQNGSQIEYGNIINKDEVVEYGFAITNNGSENLYNLSFTDNDIGVKIDGVNGLKVTGSRVYDVNGGSLEATDLVAVVSGPGYDDITVTFANNEELKAFMASLTDDAVIENGGGLWKESKVLIRGIGYRLTDAQVKAGVFDNTVFSASTNLTKSKTLQGQATMRVFVPSDPMYYQWASHDLVVTKSDLITDILAAASQEDNVLYGKVPNLTTGNVNKIVFCKSNGTEITSENATISSSYDLTINYSTTGSYVFYIKITYNSNANNAVVPVLVNVTDVKDSVYVLDYGLTADLTDDLHENDTLTVPGRNTDYKLEGVTADTPSYKPNNITFTNAQNSSLTGEFGKYSLSDKALSYTPQDFMEGYDEIYTAVRVYEGTASSGIGNVNINREVEMFKKVTVLPATVVYYEDDFPAIKYEEAQNIITTDGKSTNLEQNVDNNENYGHDNVYQVAGNVNSSAGTLTTITIKDTNTFASFEFKGTGFEIIGRTDANNAGIMIVSVYEKGGENPVKRIPVITEYDNGANGGNDRIHQVPVVRVKGLDSEKTYEVKISGIPKRDYENWDGTGSPEVINSFLYIDGLRIYQPLGDSDDNYTAEENGATFAEIRNLIAGGSVAVAEYEEVYDESDEFRVVSVSVSSGTRTNTQTWVENRNGDAYVEVEGEEEPEVVENVVGSVDDYLRYGPNNEVYLEGTYSYEALVFYVKEDAEADAHNLQVAMRAIDAGLFKGALEEGEEAGVEARVKYAIETENGIEWQTITELGSSTEQYYTIDYTQCPYDAETGYYQVVITVGDPDEDEDEYDAVDSMVSFSTLKYNGLEIVAEDTSGNAMFNDTATISYVGGVLPLSKARMLVRSVLKAPVTQASTSKESTTEESTTKESETEESTTEEAITEESTTEKSETEESSTEESTTEESTTEESTTDESETEESETEESETEESETEESETEESETEESTSEESETEESVEESTTEESTSEEVPNGEATSEESTV